MITHYVILSSSYSKGKRIALDYVIIDNSNVQHEKLKQIFNKIIVDCGKRVARGYRLVKNKNYDKN